jgi:hypothetical protein
MNTLVGHQKCPVHIQSDQTDFFPLHTFGYDLLFTNIYDEKTRAAALSRSWPAVSICTFIVSQAGCMMRSFIHTQYPAAVFSQYSAIVHDRSMRLRSMERILGQKMFFYHGL